MIAEEIREATLEDEHLSALADIILHTWPSTKAGLQKEPNYIGCSGMR